VIGGACSAYEVKDRRIQGFTYIIFTEIIIIVYCYGVVMTQLAATNLTFMGL